jgi:hypothetical protein
MLTGVWVYLLSRVTIGTEMALILSLGCCLTVVMHMVSGTGNTMGIKPILGYKFFFTRFLEELVLSIPSFPHRVSFLALFIVDPDPKSFLGI